MFSISLSRFYGQSALPSLPATPHRDGSLSDRARLHTEPDRFTRFSGSASPGMPGCLAPDERFWKLMGTTMPKLVDRSKKVLRHLSFDRMDPDFLKELIQAYKSDPDRRSVKKTRVYGTLPEGSKPPYKGTVGLAQLEVPGEQQILGRHIVDWRYAKKTALPL